MLQEVLTERTITIIPQNGELFDDAQLHAGGWEPERALTGATFAIRLLGDFHVLNRELRASGLDTPRLQALFAYLVLHRGTPQTRSRLAYLFWPDSTDGQAHTNLRNLLFKLRTTLPEIDAFLCIEQRTVRWRTDASWSLDVADFERALAQAESAAGVRRGCQALSRRPAARLLRRLDLR